MDDKFCPRCFKKFGMEPEKCPECEIRLVAALDKDLTGKVLDDRYEVISVLGKGGMGVVYRAKQKIIDRPVALKVLRRELIQDESSVKRFLVEAKASSSLRSPHTITLYDFGITQEGLLYFTMEMLEGTVLTEAILEDSPFPPARAGRIILQACESLKEAHAAGILHRDLKPDNIFLIPGPDGKEHVKVLDFGIAKILDDGASESITKTGMVCGTPMYLSPEQAVGKPLDARSDAYSLGIILYEMLSGEPPFVDATPVGVLMKQVSEAPAPISARKPEVKIPAALERFLMLVLSKDPDDRPKDIAEMSARLTAVLAGKDDVSVRMPGLMATHAGVQIPTAEFYAENEQGAGATAPLLEDVGASAASKPDADDAVTRPSLQMESITPGKSRRGLFVGLAVVAVVAISALVLVLAFPSSPGNETESSATGTKQDEVAADVRAGAPEEARPAGIAAETAAAEAALASDQKATANARAEAERRVSELAAREKLLQEKEEQLAKAEELADREKALAEREKAAQDAEVAANAAALAQAEAAAKAKAEEEAAELAAATAEAEAKAAAAKNDQVAKSGDADAAKKRAREARERADRAKADRRRADEQKRAAERARKKAEADRKKAEAEKKKNEKNEEPDFEDI